MSWSHLAGRLSVPPCTANWAPSRCGRSGLTRSLCRDSCKRRGAKSFEEFRAPFAEWPILPLNLVYADTRGNIGYQLVGQAPRRRRGNGTVPTAGWHPDAGWEDEGVPFDDMPHVVNPSCGYVASANTQPQPHGDGPYLGIDWIDGYRLGRVTEALEERSDWDVDSTAAFHMDVKSIPWTEIREHVLAETPGSDEARAAREILENWDGRMAADSAGATLFPPLLPGDVTTHRPGKSAPIRALAVGPQPPRG